MTDIDHNLAEASEKFRLRFVQVPVAYFLGAGATRADYPAIPLGDELLKAILKETVSGEYLRKNLSQVFANEGLQADTTVPEMVRIDDVFSVLDSAIAGRAPTPASWSSVFVRKLRSAMVSTMGRVLTDVLDASAAPITELLVKKAIAEEAPIVSTNYDFAVDRSLCEAKNVSYGVSVRWPVGFQGAFPGKPHHEDKGRHLQRLPWTDVNTGPVCLLKVHGSLNWLYCARCDELDITPSYGGAAIVMSAEMVGRCAAEHCTGRYEEVLVGPSVEQRYEHRVLRETWILAEAYLRHAESLVIIGYSLPEADYFVRAMLIRAFAQRSDRVTVVDLASKNGGGRKALESRYRRLLPHCSFTWDGLEGYLSRPGL
jgi:hypothetical protein